MLTECEPRHRHQEFLGFLKRIDEAVPAALEVHLIMETMPPISVKELIAKINHFVQRYNRNSRPFAWTATADSILQKLSRLCTSISGDSTLAAPVA